MGTRGTIDILLSLVIGLALVGTVATSTTSGSTALAGFSGAQALVFILPLIFVALLLYDAAQHISAGKRQFDFGYKLKGRLPQFILKSVAKSLFWVNE